MSKSTKNTLMSLFVAIGMATICHAEEATKDGFNVAECKPFGNPQATDFCSPKAIALYKKVAEKPVGNFGTDLTLLYFRSEIKDTNSLAHTYAVLDTKTKKVYPFDYAIFKIKPNGQVDNSKTQPKVYISNTQSLCMKDSYDLVNDGEINKSFQSGVRSSEDKKQYTSLCFGFDKTNGFSAEPFYPLLKQNLPINFKLPSGF